MDGKQFKYVHLDSGEDAGCGEVAFYLNPDDVKVTFPDGTQPDGESLLACPHCKQIINSLNPEGYLRNERETDNSETGA